MENQHRKISGYRELSAEEIASMNDLKEMEKALLDVVDAHITAYSMHDTGQSVRWLRIAKTHFEEGFMAAVRAVAKPNGE